MAQTSGQQSDPFEFYEQKVGLDQSISPFRKLLWMALAFNLGCPRSFTSKEIIQKFETDFLQHIYIISNETYLKTINTKINSYNIPELKKHMRASKQSFSQMKRLLDRIKSPKDNVKLYNELNTCIEHFEMALSFQKELTYSDVYPANYTLSHCKQRLEEIHEYLSSNSYYDIELPYIDDSEREIREDIILTIITIPDDQICRYLPEKDGILKDLRQAKIGFNQILDELDNKNRTQADDKRLDKLFVTCEQCIDQIYTQWNSP